MNEIPKSVQDLAGKAKVRPTEYPLYYVTSDGNVISCARWRKRPGPRFLKKPKSKGGYEMVYISGKMRYVHRLIIKAFKQNPPGRTEVRHLNGNPADNRLDNLAWGTVSDNIKDAKRHGTFSPPPKNEHVRGSINGQSKLTESDVKEIRRLLATGEYYHREIASKFNISDRTVGDIKRGKSWSWLK